MMMVGADRKMLIILPPSQKRPCAAVGRYRRRFGYCRLFLVLRREGESSRLNRISRSITTKTRALPAKLWPQFRSTRGPTQVGL